MNNLTLAFFSFIAIALVAGCINSQNKITEFAQEAVPSSLSDPKMDSKTFTEKYSLNGHVWSDTIFYFGKNNNVHLNQTMCEILGNLPYILAPYAGIAHNTYDQSTAVFAQSLIKKELEERLLNLLNQYAKEIGLPLEHRIEINHENSNLIIKSPELVPIIKSFYSIQQYENIFALDPEMFNGPDYKLKLGYLKGAYAENNGKDNSMRFYSKEKLKIVATLLRDMHCDQITTVEGLFIIPGGTTLFFQPTDAMRKYLEIEKIKRVKIK
jgi:hypothetical protein